VRDRERWRQVSEVLDRVLDTPAASRAELLDRVGSGDPDLRREVEEILAASERDGRLSRPVLDLGAPLLGLKEEGRAAPDRAQPPPPGGRIGEVIGSYRILSELGQGGMGEVWLAERIGADFEQRVALKLLRAGLDSAQIEARFRRERRILAGLEHPHIARFLDGGITPEGRPYFVMEAVEGEPITDYCERRKLELEERLRLFLEVCGAVAAAHRRLVVHRDLKPSNILVSTSGGVKLLDFGIAKLLTAGTDGADPLNTPAALDASEGSDSSADPDAGGSRSEDSGLRTAREERWLTPAYAAPEQIAGDPVTTATDVYSLGVVLYELLSGTRPFAAASRRELERAILDRDPDRPSDRLASAPEVATMAAIPPAGERRARRLRGDLDAIVLQALRKEPERRYPSVDALASDLQRFLDGRTVTARPDSFAYRSTKFVRRHRFSVATSAAAVLALVAGLALALVSREREAVAARRAVAVRDFLIRLIEQASPEVNGGDEPSLRQVVEEGTRAVEPELAGEPVLAADLLSTLAALHLQLGEFGRGLELAERAYALSRRELGEKAPESIAALARVGEGLHHMEDNPAALEALDRAAALARAASGEDSPALAEVLERKGDVLRRLGRFDEAIAALEQARAIHARASGERSEPVNVAETGLAEVLFQRSGEGDNHRALGLAREVLARRQASLPPGHPGIGRALHNVALYVHHVGGFEEAERLYGEALAIQTRASGPDHPFALESRSERAAALSELGRYDEALAELEIVAAGWKRRAGATSWGYCNAINKVGYTLYQRGRAAEAVPRFAEVLGVFRARLGPEHPDTLSAWSNFGGALAESGDLERAERELVELLAIRRRVSERLVVVPTLSMLGRTLRRKGDPNAALALHREAIAIDIEALGAEHVDTALARYLAGLALIELRSFEPAAAELEQALAIDREKRTPGHTRIGEDLTALARVRLAEGRPSAAEALAREAVGIQGAAVGAANGKTADARLVLGEALLAAGRRREGRTEIAAALALLEKTGASYAAAAERARRALR
jgi:eukaryotic-like serine/threonine-protein kinase